MMFMVNTVLIKPARIFRSLQKLLQLYMYRICGFIERGIGIKPSLLRIKSQAHDIDHLTLTAPVTTTADDNLIYFFFFFLFFNL